MDVVADKLESRSLSTLSLVTLMEDWQLDDSESSNPTKSARHDCFLEVEARACKLLQTEALGKLRDSVLGKDTAILWYETLYSKLCLPSAQKLLKLLDKLQLDHRYFVLAFDECSEIGISASDDTGNPEEDLWKLQAGGSLIGLQRIIKAGDRYHVSHDKCDITLWHLLLDTSSSISDLAPSGVTAVSSRLRNKLQVLPPWSYLGFNRMVDRNHTKKIKTPADVLTLKHQKPYGRPVSKEVACAYFCLSVV